MLAPVETPRYLQCWRLVLVGITDRCHQKRPAAADAELPLDDAVRMHLGDGVRVVAELCQYVVGVFTEQR